MKTVLISDTHLTPKFEKRKFAYLKNLFSKVDRIIINGDFWDGYLCSFREFTTSRWHRLFPILKKKNAIYLFGNHDKKEWSDTNVNLFSSAQKHIFYLPFGNKELVIQHGNQIHKTFAERHPWLVNPLTTHFSIIALKLGVKIVGSNFYNFYYPRAIKTKQRMQAWASERLTKEQILVCGHSHILSFEPENQLVNTGFIQHGFGHYVLLTKEKINLIKERY